MMDAMNSFRALNSLRLCVTNRPRLCVTKHPRLCVMNSQNMYRVMISRSAITVCSRLFLNLTVCFVLNIPFRFVRDAADIYFCLIKAIFLLKERSDGGGTISRLFGSLSVCLSVTKYHKIVTTSSRIKLQLLTWDDFNVGRPNAPKIATTIEY